VSTKDIRTSGVHIACDVCGRTLLRGERAEVYLDGGSRRSVCELCTSRALHEGWVREGTVPPYQAGDSGAERRRSLLARLRARREVDAAESATSGEDRAELAATEPAAPKAPRRTREPVREPRHVRAVPTSVEQKMASAIEMFNESEHRRTLVGVARSLGPPAVSVRPSSVRASLVNIVLSWELCWYRYEVDLSDDQPSVRVAGQGYELDELDETERELNAVADDHGALGLE
jgi:hypothetical protein